MVIGREDYKYLIINVVLKGSIELLYQEDYDNIRFGVSERNVCARLAHHMEDVMRKYDCQNKTRVFAHYFADVEYNRMGDGDLKHYENSQHIPIYMVSDLIIHTRGISDNLLALEMKRKGNSRNIEKDRERLVSLVSSSLNSNQKVRCVSNTLLGAFLIYSETGAVIELYESVKGVGMHTRTLNFDFFRTIWSE